MKRKLIILLLALPALYFLPQKSVAQFNIGLALKGSTVGLGGDVILRFNPKMDVRLGFETLATGFDFDFKENHVDYDANAHLKLGSVSALFDYSFGSSFFATAGLAYNLFNLSIAGHASKDMPFGDVYIDKDKIGTFDVSIDPSLKITPYLGIGVGKPLGKEKNLALAIEIGTFYQGAPDITVQSEGLLAPTSNPSFGREALMESQINHYYLYPVLKLSISYKIL